MGGRCIFFFISGVQPKKIELEERVRVCPSCGVFAAKLVRLDHYFSMFFIPIFPIKYGPEILECTRCGAVFDPQGRTLSKTKVIDTRTTAPANCPRCYSSLEKHWIYCPNCGQKVRAA